MKRRPAPTDPLTILYDKAKDDCRRAGLNPHGHYHEKTVTRAFARLDARDAAAAAAKAAAEKAG